MLTIAHKEVLADAASLCGLDPEALALADFTRLTRWINRWARHAWESYLWPQLIAFEERAYRPTWVSTATYAQSAEVWHSPTQAYYFALGPITAGDEPSLSSATWDLIPGFPAEVTLDSTLGTLRRVYQTDPRRDRRLPIDFRLEADRAVLLAPVGATVFLEHRLPCPEWTGAEYDPTLTYAAAARIYFGGDYHEALAAAAPGEDPATAPAKWRKIAFPSFLRAYVAQMAHADYLRSNGQQDKAILEEERATTWLAREWDKIEYQSSQARTWRIRLPRASQTYIYRQAATAISTPPPAGFGWSVLTQPWSTYTQPWSTYP